MAQNRYEMIISAENLASKELKQVASDLNVLSKEQKGFSESTKQSIKTTTAWATGIATAGGMMVKSLVANANEAIRGQKQLEAVLKSTGGVAGMTAEAVLDLSNQLAKNTTITDDAILSGQNMLLTFTNIGKDVFPMATETMLDMATAMNNGVTPTAQELSAQAIQLGKALNDPIDGISSLSRVGVQFTEEQKEQIKTLVESGNTMQAQKLILGELAREFGGSATAQAQTFEGQMINVKKGLGEVWESIGIQLIPILTVFAEKLSGLVTWFQALSPETQKMIGIAILLTTALAGVVAVFGAIALALPVITAGFGALGVVVGALTSPIGLVVLAIGALAIAWETNLFGIQDKAKALVWLLKKNWDDIQTQLAEFILSVGEKWDNFKAKTMEIWEGVVSVITGAIDSIKSTIDGLFTRFNSLKNAVANSSAYAGASNLIEKSGIGPAIRNIAGVNMKANGGVFTGGFHAFANGGIVNQPTLGLVGEGSMNEAIVPLPDGKSIPVQMKGNAGSVTVNFGDVHIAKEVDAENFFTQFEMRLSRAMRLNQQGSI